MKTHAAVPHAIALPDDHRWPGDRLVRYVRDRFLLLPLGALFALVWANTAAESYFRFSHALAFGVNEIGMAVFLALIAQEVREALMPGGALHTWRRWGLCLIGAAGGMLGAACAYLLYVGLKYETVLSPAWPVACAIDAAAAYYVLKTIRIRRGALPFILLLALATDALGLVVVALRSQGGVEIPPVGALLMLAALGLAGLLRVRNVRAFWPYLIVCGALSWWGLSIAGIHPALALVPIVPFLPREPRSLDLFAEPRDDDAVHHAEHEWNGLAQVVLFFFGLVNAGVILSSFGTGTHALLAAAVVGRPIGILAAVGLAVAVGFHLPRRIGWRDLIVIALATSSGFTFALFFATGILPTGPVLAEIKLGALATVTAAAGTIGAAWLLRVGRFARSTDNGGFRWGTS